MDEFHKRYGMLADVQDKMNVKIRQVTGLRDGVRASLRWFRLNANANVPLDFDSDQC